MSTLTPHGKILIEMSNQARALAEFYQRKIVAEMDDDDDDDLVSLYALERLDIETIGHHLTDFARLLRSLADEVLATV